MTAALRLVLYLLAGLVAVALWMMVLLGPGHAHSWYTGMQDPISGLSCCGGNDCAEIGDDEVTPVPNGYQVHVRQFMNVGPIEGFVPNEQARPAKEGGSYHLCVVQGAIRCFFFPAPSY